MVDMASAIGGATSVTSAGRTSLASNFETFLQLLTAQLRNQDPLSPMDSNEFTAQLTQMAGVEQQLLTNDLLQSLVTQASGGLGSAVQFIGKEVVAAGSAVELQNGEATWSYELAADAANVRLEVLNSRGEVVWTGDAPEAGEGLHDFTWDGEGTNGIQRDDGGVYTLRIAEARTSTGTNVDAQVLIRGVVTGVEMYNGEPYLTVGGSILPLSQVISVNAFAAAPEPEPETPGALSAIGGMARDLMNPLDEISALAGALNPLRLF